MSLSFLGNLASLLPGYVQGQRQAVQDNWTDLQNYNNVQAGQQANAFTEATWQPRLDMVRDAALNSTMGIWGNVMDLGVKASGWPGAMSYAQAGSAAAPYLAPMQQWAQYYGLGNALMQQPGFTSWMLQQQMPQMQGQFATQPSRIR